VSSWLESLPHQIPFRATSDAVRIDERNIEGDYICTAGDGLAEGVVLQSMIFEAMAQLGGGLAFDSAGTPGMLSGIDRATLHGPLEAGDRLHIRVTLEANFGGLFRLSGVADRDGTEYARARFYLAEPGSGEG
jgi:hypothetical protein